MKLIEWLKLPECKNIKDLDDPETTMLHSAIIQNKPFLKNIYIDFYNQFKGSVRGEEGCFVEIGSGGGFIGDVMPNVIKTDILNLPNVDLRLSGVNLSFKSSSVDAIFMLNVFHHIHNPGNFLNEVTRCLKTGGKLVLIEPANTFWGRFIYKNFHHEEFDPKADWGLEDTGPLTVANGALPWIVFCRDKEKLKKQYPKLEVLKVKYHTPLRYLLSGGVSLRQLVPSFLYGFIQVIEVLLTPLNNVLGMFMKIEIQKK